MDHCKLRCARALVFVGIVSACVVGCSAEGVDTNGSGLDFNEATQAEVNGAFYESVLYCERRLLQIPTSQPRALALGDVALSFAQEYRAGKSEIPEGGPHAGPFPERQNDRVSNACRVPLSLTSPSPDSSLAMEDGFCRADFNYCLGKELELHAKSAQRSISPLTRASILRRSRERLSAAAVEYVSSLAFYGVRCQQSLPGFHYTECLRLEDGYDEVVTARMLDSISGIESIMHEEAGIAASLSDAQLEDLGSLTEEQQIARLWGPDGYRAEALSRLYGPTDGVEISAVPVTRRFSDAPMPISAVADDRGSLALALATQFRVPVGFLRFTGPGTQEIGLYTGGWEVPTYVSATTNLLDHRMLANEFLPPYEDFDDPLANALRSSQPMDLPSFLAYAGSPLPPEVSILQTRYQLGEQDVGEAMKLAVDAYEVSDANVVTWPQVSISTAESDNTEYLAAEIGATAGGRVHRLEAAISDTSEDLPVDIQEPQVALVGSDGSPVVDNFYDLSLARVDGSMTDVVARDPEAILGAAGTLQLLRGHLLRFQNADLRFVDGNDLQPAIALIDGALGDRWFETDGWRSLRCACLTDGPFDIGEPVCFGVPYDTGLYRSSSCLKQRSRPDYLTWRVVFPEEQGQWRTGRAVAVRSWDRVLCLERNLHPGTRDECQWPAEPLMELTPAPGTENEIGRSTRQFRIDDLDTFTETGSASHLYILWESDEGGYTLVDAIKPLRGGGVHSAGGSVRQRAAEIWDKMPTRPATPVARGSETSLVSSLVPPLESELTSDSDGYEDSYARYLAEAEDAALRAGALLRQARDGEFMTLQNEASDQAQLRAAELAETEALSELCGTRGNCSPERAAPVTLFDLRVVPTTTEPTLPPELGLTDVADCREFTDSLFANFVQPEGTELDEEEYKQQASAFFKTSIDCSIHFLRERLGPLTITGLPVAVLTAFESGGSGQFAEFDGAVRDELIRQFQSLSEVATAFRILDGHEAALRAMSRAAVTEVAWKALDESEVNMCRFQAINSVIQDVASIVQSAGSFSSAGEGADAQARYESQQNNARQTGSIGQDVASLGKTVEGLARSGGCDNQASAQDAGSDALQALAQGTETLHSIAAGVRNHVYNLYSSLGRLSSLESAAEHAEQRREIAERLIATDNLADLPEWRSLQAFRWRRAHRALERAKQAAHTARRAIEFRLGVELQTMAAPEPFVPPPASWADDIYAIETVSYEEEARGGETVSVDVTSEAIVDYLQRLRDFVNGYGFERRFRDSRDFQVLDLRNLLSFREDEPISRQFQYWCADSTDVVRMLDGPEDLRPHPCVELGGVAEASILFEIPVRLDGYLAERLAAAGFNHRHESLAVNLTGIGIIDCERALYIDDCYSGANVQLDIRQEGNALVEGYDGNITAFGLEPGVIQRARALVAERVLTVPLSSTDQSLIAPFQRYELRGRPLSGVYRVTIPGRPEINWEKIDTVQMALGYLYWTRQR